MDNLTGCRFCCEHIQNVSQSGLINKKKHAHTYIQGSSKRQNVIVAFLAGGVCWDAATCGLADLNLRTLAIDARDDIAGPSPAILEEFTCVPDPLT
jgi:hypothetical protein